MANNVYDHPTSSNHRPDGGDGGPPDMDQRLRQLEQDMAVVKETMSTREDLLATREDIQKTINSQTWKIITAMGVMMTIMTSIFAGVVGFL